MRKQFHPVSLSAIWFLALETSNYIEKTSGRTNLKDVKTICGFLDDKIEEMDFAAFKSAFYRARQRLKKVKPGDTK